MEKSIQWQQAQVDERHPELARARAVAGLCALGQGQRAHARELLGRAQAALAAQPDVSPYFKRPAMALAARLGSPGSSPR
jgi:Tfp pilus assembly protein PilF